MLFTILIVVWPFSVTILLKLTKQGTLRESVIFQTSNGEGVSFDWLSKTSLATFLHIFSWSVTIKIKRDPTCVCVRAWPLWYILPMISTCICYYVIIIFHSMTCYRNFIYPLSLLIMFVGRYCNDII